MSQSEVDEQVARREVHGTVNLETATAGLFDDRGNYNASVNTFPAAGGSGDEGAILKGDIWQITVAGTLGGDPVQAGDWVRALTDTPGQTAGNWGINKSSGIVETIVAGDGVGVDNTDPANPVISTIFNPDALADMISPPSNQGGLKIEISADGLSLTVSGAGTPEANGAYHATGADQGQYFYNKGVYQDHHQSAVSWNSENWEIYGEPVLAVAVLLYQGTNSEIGFPDVEWSNTAGGSVGSLPLPTVVLGPTENRLLPVTVGAADSGGTGLRAITIPNLV
jgi:hypothetical protein